MIVVTGAAQGIGFAIAKQFAEQAGSVTLLDINADRLHQATTELSSQGMKVASTVCDVSNPAEVVDAFAKIAENRGVVDVLVNSAGVLRTSKVREIDEGEWDLVVDTNLKGTFFCSQSVLGGMTSQGYGKIVNIASMAGRATSTLGGAHYTAAKAGVLGLTRHLARESAPYHVNVNAVCPGIVDTPMVRAVLTPDLADRVNAGIPFGRLAAPEEVAALVLFLSSDQAAYITGSSVDIHGGEMIIQ